MRHLIVVAALLAALLPLPIVADHNPGGLLPNLPTSFIKKAEAQGYVTYALDQNARAYPNFREQAQQVVQAGIDALNIPAYEVADNPMLWLTMPADGTFLSICGNGAAGCIQYWGDPVMVFFRRALLYTDWRSAIGHEGINYGHAFGEHEQYDDVHFICTRKTWTVMDCGSGVWQPQPFDVDLVRKVVVPQPVNGASLDLSGRYGAAVLWYGPSSQPARRVAVFIETVGFPLVWAGFWGPVSTSGIEGVAAPYLPNTCMWIGAENALPTTWGASMVLAGCTQ